MLIKITDDILINPDKIQFCILCIENDFFYWEFYFCGDETRTITSNKFRTEDEAQNWLKQIFRIVEAKK